MSLVMEHDIWFYRAKQDWLTIDRLISSGPWSHVCFHAQQAAEKCLKGFIRFKTKEPPRIHDLSELLSIAKGYDPSLQLLEDDCNNLTLYAVDARYEEIQDEFDKELASAAVDAAKRICFAIRERIPYTIPY